MQETLDFLFEHRKSCVIVVFAVNADDVEVYEEERDNEPDRDRLDGRDDDDEEDEEDGTDAMILPFSFEIYIYIVLIFPFIVVECVVWGPIFAY